MTREEILLDGAIDMAQQNGDIIEFLGKEVIEIHNIKPLILNVLEEIKIELNSRTCSSCKYYQKNIEAFGEYKGECTNLIIYDSDLGTVPHGFLCNEWEKKDD